MFIRTNYTSLSHFSSVHGVSSSCERKRLPPEIERSCGFIAWAFTCSRLAKDVKRFGGKTWLKTRNIYTWPQNRTEYSILLDSSGKEESAREHDKETFDV